HLGAVVEVAQRVEGALAAGDAGGAQTGVLVNQDCHDYAAASSTTLAAAPSMVDSVYTLGSAASASRRRPSTSLVPSRRTTKGTVGLIWWKASIRPLATSSQ